ncbi:Protein CBG26518 [Caenorhabditis briggsae]|uniref:Uncharacterized protein n=2 Tax=Caenorhabditis briggsae TaxID=6238 RepID=A0AAE9D706_CAEBR|nr:Protein CBG26518 [Caenorhabditis briggsae]ULT97826.1 hypothetical protein L3Y34_005573 [Caenorhabditis briggsae]CAR99881.1 Protein CBG26518 [Caenorhabditis briggsae]
MIFSRRKSVYSLLRLILLLICIKICTSDLFEKSEPCQDVLGKELHCPSNFIYYFECCSNECCLRTQVLPAIVIAFGAIVMTLFCLVSCVAYCCCGD